MAWRTVEVREQRIRFVVAAHRGDRTLSSLCMEFGISRPTGSLWLKRYRAGGVAAVACSRPGSADNHIAPSPTMRRATRPMRLYFIILFSSIGAKALPDAELAVRHGAASRAFK